MYPTDLEAKEMLCEYSRRIYNRGLVGGNEGNLSCRVGPNEIWCTPTMESKGYLTPDMMIKMDLDGNILNESAYKPSSECKMHLGQYRENPKIMAVVHAHPPTATAYACCGKPVDSTFLPEAIGLFGKEIKIAKYGMPGTMEVPESVKPFAKTDLACLLQNHGALTWGPSLQLAYFVMEVLEGYCNTYRIATRELEGAQSVPSAQSMEQLLKMHDGLLTSIAGE